MSYVAVGAPIAQPMFIKQAEQPQQEVPENTKLLKSYVGRWFSTLRLICICTMLFSVFGLLFSVLDEYNEQGEKTKDGISFQSLQGSNGYLFALPIFFPLFVLLFMSAEGFANERSNEGKNVDGVTNRIINGKEVRRMVFDNVWWAMFVTFFTWICFIGSFSVFYSFGIPRCKQENQDLNTGWSFLPSKAACGIAFKIGVMQIILAAIIVIGSGVLWFRFYYSMPMTDRKKALSKGKEGLAKVKSRGAQMASGGAQMASGGAQIASGGAQIAREGLTKARAKVIKRQQARRNSRLGRQLTQQQQHQAATQLQSAMRQRKVRKVVEAAQQQHQAATQLQSAMRQRKARKVVEAAQQQQAATQLQSAMRQRKARKVVEAAQQQQARQSPIKTVVPGRRPSPKSPRSLSARGQQIAAMKRLSPGPI